MSQRRIHGLALAGLMTAVVLLVSACGSGPIPGQKAPSSVSSTSTSTSNGCPASPPSSITIDATNALRFVPATACLKVGGTVTWKNTGDILHTTTDDPADAATAANAARPAGAAPWNHPLPPGSSWSLKLTVAGVYKYFCIPHETLGMLGQITVVS